MYRVLTTDLTKMLSNDIIKNIDGSKKGIVGKIASISREYCDFGKGFYCGTNPMQPLTLISSEVQPMRILNLLIARNCRFLNS